MPSSPSCCCKNPGVSCCQCNNLQPSEVVKLTLPSPSFAGELTKLLPGPSYQNQQFQCPDDLVVENIAAELKVFSALAGDWYLPRTATGPNGRCSYALEFPEGSGPEGRILFPVDSYPETGCRMLHSFSPFESVVYNTMDHTSGGRGAFANIIHRVTGIRLEKMVGGDDPSWRYPQAPEGRVWPCEITIAVEEEILPDEGDPHCVYTSATDTSFLLRLQFEMACGRELKLVRAQMPRFIRNPQKLSGGEWLDGYPACDPDHTGLCGSTTCAPGDGPCEYNFRERAPTWDRNLEEQGIHDGEGLKVFYTNYAADPRMPFGDHFIGGQSVSFGDPRNNYPNYCDRRGRPGTGGTFTFNPRQYQYDGAAWNDIAVREIPGYDETVDWPYSIHTGQPACMQPYRRELCFDQWNAHRQAHIASYRATFNDQTTPENEIDGGFFHYLGWGENGLGGARLRNFIPFEEIVDLNLGWSVARYDYVGEVDLGSYRDGAKLNFEPSEV